MNCFDYIPCNIVDLNLLLFVFFGILRSHKYGFYSLFGHNDLHIFQKIGKAVKCRSINVKLHKNSFFNVKKVLFKKVSSNVPL